MSDSPKERPAITVEEFVARSPAALDLRMLAGARGAASHCIDVARIQKLGLALAGFSHYIHPGRVQIVGQSEIWFLNQLPFERRREAIRNLMLEEMACVVVTKGLVPPPEFVEEAERAALPLLLTPLVSSVAIGTITEFLHDALAPRETRHGVLLDLYGVGVFLQGQSGIGKSECALDLIVRGHRLVSDDLVELRRIAPDRLIGSAPDLLREHIEIRGLGILNVRDLFGVSAISGPKPVGLAITFQRWEEAEEIDRLGLDDQTVNIFGVYVPSFLLPVSPGRNLSTLVETAVRVHLLRVRGYNAAHTFVARHAALIDAAGEAGPTEESGADDLSAAAAVGPEREAGDELEDTAK